jgi:glycyl-tRNA synthetase beta chain
MLNALLEIGCEEIPARFLPDFLADLKKKAAEKLTRERLTFAKVVTLGTGRRLTLYVEGLAPKQTNLSEEVRGPAAEIAFDAGGHPTPAAIGFAKSQQVNLNQLTIRTINNRNYVFALAVRRGKTAKQVLAKIFPEVISSLYLPLAMRWGNLDVKFIRPIHWIVALCGNHAVKFEYAGIKSGNITQGHCFLKLKIKNVKVKNA